MSGRRNPIAILALLAVGLAVVAVWRIAGSDPEPAATAIATEAPTLSAQASAADAGSPADAPAPESSPASEAALSLAHPDHTYPVVWVRGGHEVEIRTEPGGGELVGRAGKRTEFGSPTVFGVVRRSGPWAAVTTAKLPNDRLGWIRLDPRRLHDGWTELSIVVDLSERRAELRESGEPVRSFPVTVGMPGADTPTGRFAVTDTLRGGLGPAYGCCAVALSATQPNLPSGWLGGNRIAIHGTGGQLGVATSHGCVRAADADVSKLVSRVPLGTPVFIRS